MIYPKKAGGQTNVTTNLKKKAPRGALFWLYIIRSEDFIGVVPTRSGGAGWPAPALPYPPVE